LKLATADGVVGGTIWPAASAMCRYLLQLQQRRPPPEHILELGAGTGAVGIYAAALLGVPVKLTEHKPPLEAVITSVPYSVDGTLDEWEAESFGKTSDRLLKLLQSNVDRNSSLFTQHSSPVVKELEWGTMDHVELLLSSTTNSKGYDMILASDVTYQSTLHDRLAKTIATLLAKSTEEKTKEATDAIPPTCLVSHQERFVDWNGVDRQLSSFQRAITKVGLEIVQTTPHPVTVGTKTHDTFILEIQHSN
jgi:predicted nicotinamide N-methyase